MKNHEKLQDAARRNQLYVKRCSRTGMSRATVSVMLALGWLQELPHGFDPEKWDKEVANDS